MEVFNITNTTEDGIFDYIKTVYDHKQNRTVLNDDERKFLSFVFVLQCIIVSIGLPLTLMAIYTLHSMVRSNDAAPIYVINLLMSDLIHFCCMIVRIAKAKEPSDNSTLFSQLLSLYASVGFMVCIALERYLVIAFPLWYRFRRTIKITVAVSVAVWVITLACSVPLLCGFEFRFTRIPFGIFFLIALPLLIFFLGGTIRALSASRVPTDEKRRIVAILVLVLLIYTLLFLPTIIQYLEKGNTFVGWNLYLSFGFRRLSPLADLLLYVFMRKGTIDKLLATMCCCRMNSNHSSRTNRNDVCSSSV